MAGNNNSSGNSERGLAAADQETRQRVAREGGEARAKQMEQEGGRGGESSSGGSSRGGSQGSQNESSGEGSRGGSNGGSGSSGGSSSNR